MTHPQACWVRTLEPWLACLQVRAHSLYQSLVCQGQQGTGVVEVSSDHAALSILVLILGAACPSLMCVYVCVCMRMRVHARA